MRAHIAQFRNRQEDLLRMGYKFTERDVAESLIMSLPKEDNRHMKQGFNLFSINPLTFQTVKKTNLNNFDSNENKSSKTGSGDGLQASRNGDRKGFQKEDKKNT